VGSVFFHDQIIANLRRIRGMRMLAEELKRGNLNTYYRGSIISFKYNNFLTIIRMVFTT